MQLIWSRTYNFLQMHNRSHFCKGSQLPTRRAADRHKLSQSLEGTVALPKSEVPSLLCSAGPSCGSQPDGAPADTPQMFINITQTALTICHQSSRAPEKQHAALQARHSPEQHQNNHQTHLTGKRVIFTLCTDARFHLLHILKHAWCSYYEDISRESLYQHFSFSFDKNYCHIICTQKLTGLHCSPSK